MVDYERLAEEEAAQTAEPENNIYDQMAREEAASNQAQLTTVLDLALKDDPELAAERKRLSDATGLPPDMVKRNQDELKRREQLRRIDVAQMMRDHPILARQMLDPTFATASIDDLDRLKSLEKYARSGEMLDDTVGGVKTFGMGMTAGVGKMLFDVFGATTDLVGMDYLAGGFRQMSHNAARAMDEMGMQVDTSTGRAVKSGLMSTGQNLALMPLGLERGLFKTAQGAGSAVAGAMSAGVGADAYLRARDQGLGRFSSLSYGMTDGAVEFAMERLPATQLFKGIELDQSILKTLGQQMLTEGWTEQVTTFAQDFNAWMQLNPEKSASAFLSERPDAAYETLVATLVGSGLQTGAIATLNKAVERMSSQKIQYDLDAYQRAMNLAGESALRNRSPEQFRNLMAEATKTEDGQKEVFVDAEVLNQLPQEVLNQLPQSVLQQLPEALAMNATVSIPMADILTIAPGTDLESVLNDNVRMTPDSPSRVETQKAEEFIRQDAERVLQQASDAQAWQSSVDVVKNTILGELKATGRFANSVNESYASLQAAFFSTMAARVGVTPEELFSKFSLKVRAKGQQNYDELHSLDFNQPRGMQFDESAHRPQVSAWAKDKFGDRVAPNGNPAWQNFVAWFGDSQVVDESGNPLVVYHGTRSDIAQFDKRKSRTSGAFFFSPDPNFASSPAYTGYIGGREKGGGNVMPVFLIISNPKKVADLGMNPMWEAGAIEAAMNEGHDGIHVTNGDYWIAFHPEQIKSATGNQGNFDPNDAGILNQSAYHGSPYRFDKFSLDHMGSGEGAQAYGWGLYFASNRKVAEFYRGGLSYRDMVRKFRDAMPDEATAEEAMNWAASKDAPQDMARVIKALASDDWLGFDYPSQALTALFKEPESFDVSAELADAAKAMQGQLYEVEIPEDSEMLLWDKPLSEQPEKVQKALSDAGLIVDGRYGDGMGATPMFPGGMTFSGENIYKRLTEKFFADKREVTAPARKRSEQEASEYLNSLGIKGIKYLDGSSRSAGDGDHNYVIFDDAAVEILETYYQESNATFSPSQLLVTLNDSADLSSFLHESGHFFLEVMADLASQPNAPQQVVDDFAKFLKWVGVPDAARWQAMTLEEKRQHHERWAESFEQYLLEGKAPTTELQSLFRTFRQFLVSVYRSLKDWAAGHNTELNDEIREVFDRMLAVDDAIRQAEEDAGLLPDFEATNEAIEALQAKSMQNLKWTISARSKFMRQFTKQVADIRKGIAAEVSAQVAEIPAFKVQSDLKAQRKAIGRKLNEVEVAVIAEANGYDSVDAMNEDIALAGKKGDFIKRLVDQRMLEEHADKFNIEELANQAVHNEARQRAIAAELTAQERALNERQDTGRRNSKGQRITVNSMVEAAKQFAENLTARRKIKDLKKTAWQHRTAESNAGKAWSKATKEGRTQDAIQAKRDQMLNNAAAKSAQDALQSIDSRVNYLKRFDKGSVRKNIPAEYMDQIDKLLERVDLRKSVTNKQLADRASLAEWIEAQEALGMSPVIDRSLFEDVTLTSYKEMTVEDFNALITAIKNIEHLAKIKDRLLTLGDKIRFADMERKIVEDIDANSKGIRPVELEGRGQFRAWLEGFWASHRKISSMARQMHGGKDGGPLWDALIRGMNERGTWEQSRIEQATEALAKLYAPLLDMKGGLDGDKQYIHEIRASLSRGGRLSILLNWGNSVNRQRVTGGDNWTEQQVGAILARISPEEAAFANKMWEYIDSFWPEVKAKQERVSGVVEEKVEAEPFVLTLNDGTKLDMRGGYYPIKYDSDRSLASEKLEAAAVAKDMLRGAIGRSTTRRGHTKARVNEVSRPVRKSLDVITQHIVEVVHDLAWHEWLIDANRLIGSKAIDAAIRDNYGPDWVKAFRSSFEGIATADVVPQTSIDSALRMLRANISRSAMGASATTALLQPFGITNSIVRIGAKNVGRGIARWAGDASRFESSMEWISAKSEFMRLRSKTFNREISEISNRVRGKSKTMQAVDSGLFFLTAKMQLVADVPTWIGAYEGAKAEGLDEGTSVARADQAVLDAQGGGQIKDLAEIQRKHPMLTQFYSYFSTTLQLVADRTAMTDFKNPIAVGGWIADMALLLVIPAIAPGLVLAMLRGDDEEDWHAQLAEWQLSYLFGLVVGARELSGPIQGFDYTGPPVGRIIADLNKVGEQSVQGEIDEPLVMAITRLMGSAFGVPTAQLIRSYRGWEAWDNGDAPATSILFGPPPPDK